MASNEEDGDRHGALVDLQHLLSEDRNPRSMDIDLMSTSRMLELINAEDRLVPQAVARTLPDVAEAVEKIVAAFAGGGRLIYIGAGTSGRLGVLDAAECPPTFGVPPGMVVGLIAGGPDALTRAREGVEDLPDAGAADLRAVDPSSRDVVVGIAVSGRTPYVVGALAYAKSVGATTIALTCNPDSAIARMSDISIAPVVGPEVLTGSTRLKSGTAQKLVLNMLTTASMVRMGKTYQNLMVDMVASNEKLAARAVRIVVQATGCSDQVAEQALERTGRNLKLAILVILTGKSVEEARQDLQRTAGFLRRALGRDA